MSESDSSPTLHCPRCDDALPAGFKPGLCPVCLMDVAMHPTHDDTLPVAPPQAPLTPTELAPHFPQLEILEYIGRGGMGVVYKARQKALDRLVALKLLAPGQTKDAAFAERFAHEARALAALNHPNIVTVHDFGESGGFYYLLMEYVDGVNLRQAMQRSHLAPEQALAIVPPICEALQYAHDQGIVHRDIKPENLLLDKAGRVKIADFGIAKMMSRQVGAAEGGQAAASVRGTMMAGTPEYMAPEQRRSGPRTDHRADIYSLGVVLYELLTGELPTGSLEVSRQGAATDARLDEIVRRALEQDPEQRYQTVKELQTHLATLTAAPAGATVHPRDGWQRAFCWLLRAGGVGCASYGVWRLLKPETLNRPAVVPFWLEVPVLFFAAAWILIVHAGWLTRISYRPLLMPPRVLTEGFGMVLRVAGLLGIGKAVAGLRLHWIFGPGGGLEFGVVLLFFSIGLFRFEHAFAPMAYAIPGWRPLPYANTSTRRRPSGHALVSAIPLVFLLVMLPLTVALLSRRLAYETGVEWGAMPRGLAFWGCLAAIASALGWAAVNLIRGSQGRLFGLGLASASALTLPLYLGFLILTFLGFSVATRQSVSFITLADGSVREDFSRHSDLLRGAAIAAGLACLVSWLWVWKKIRALPRPSTAAARPRPRTAFAMGAGLAFAALVVAMYSLMTSKLPPSPKIPERLAAGMGMRQSPGAHTQPGTSSPTMSQPATPLPPYEPRFARHVERQLNLRLFIHGYDHTQPQGTLKLPPDRRLLSVTLPGLRDVDGNRSVKGAFELIRSEESVFVRGEKALENLRFTVSQRTPEAVLQEVVVPVPQAGTRCLASLRSNFLIEPPAALHERLQTSPENLSPEDIAWLEEHWADLMVQMEADGSVALRLLGAAAIPVTHSFPAGFDWLKLDDRELAKALAKAYAAIPAAGGSTLVRAQSPAVLAFAKRKTFGLIENLGPSKPGARDARLRISRFSFNPFR